jgi:hypothetical protein
MRRVVRDNQDISMVQKKGIVPDGRNPPMGIEKISYENHWRKEKIYIWSGNVSKPINILNLEKWQPRKK